MTYRCVLARLYASVLLVSSLLTLGCSTYMGSAYATYVEDVKRTPSTVYPTRTSAAITKHPTLKDPILIFRVFTRSGKDWIEERTINTVRYERRARYDLNSKLRELLIAFPLANLTGLIVGPYKLVENRIECGYWEYSALCVFPPFDFLAKLLGGAGVHSSWSIEMNGYVSWLDMGERYQADNHSYQGWGIDHGQMTQPSYLSRISHNTLTGLINPFMNVVYFDHFLEYDPTHRGMPSWYQRIVSENRETEEVRMNANTDIPLSNRRVVLTNPHLINGELETTSDSDGVVQIDMSRCMNRVLPGVMIDLEIDLVAEELADPLYVSIPSDSLLDANFIVPEKEHVTANTISNTPAVAGNSKSHALIIGVSSYADSRISPLRYADDDADAFASALRRQGWRDNQIEHLSDSQATAEAVENAIRYGPDLDDSLLVLYWAGHGFPDPVDARKLFLACHDTKVDSPASGVRMADIRSWLEERKARNVVIIADACHSGGLASGRSLAAHGLPRPVDVPPGWMYLLSSSISEKAVEHPSLQGGLFTTSLVEALNGAAEGYGKLGRRDGAVTMGEIEEYVRNEVQAKASKFNLQGSFKVQAVTDTADQGIWNLTLQGK